MSVRGCRFFLTNLSGSFSINSLNYFNYFTEIEDTFIRRRGKNLFLSPIDWALIEAWQGRGIPMHIVIRAIESVFDVFDQQPAGTRTIKSLFYCREEVEAQFTEWSRSQAGAHGDVVTDVSTEESEFPVDAIREHITGAIAKLNSIENPNLTDEIARAVARLDQLRNDLSDNPEIVDGTLGDIEKLLERAMLTNWDAVHLKFIESQTAAELKQYKADMDAAAYKNTFELMLIKRLREEAGIPRLGLYYL